MSDTLFGYAQKKDLSNTNWDEIVRVAVGDMDTLNAEYAMQVQIAGTEGRDIDVLQVRESTLDERRWWTNELIRRERELEEEEFLRSQQAADTA